MPISPDSNCQPELPLKQPTEKKRSQGKNRSNKTPSEPATAPRVYRDQHKYAWNVPVRPPFKGADGPCWLGKHDPMPGFVYAALNRFEKIWRGPSDQTKAANGMREAIKYLHPSEWRFVCYMIGHFLATNSDRHRTSGTEKEMISDLSTVLIRHGWETHYFDPEKAAAWQKQMVENDEVEGFADEEQRKDVRNLPLFGVHGAFGGEETAKTEPEDVSGISEDVATERDGTAAGDCGTFAAETSEDTGYTSCFDPGPPEGRFPEDEFSGYGE